METVTNQPFRIGAHVRIKASGDVGTVQGYFVTGSSGKRRILVDRPHGHSGVATLRQSFDAVDLEEVK